MTTHKTSETDRPSRSVSPYKAGFSCCCPACGVEPLFKTILELKVSCSRCGFDLSDADPGDGAQVFVILILGAVLALLGFILLGVAKLPTWLTLGVLAAIAIVGTFWLLRIFKATLVALQFHHDAREGQLEEPDA